MKRTPIILLCLFNFCVLPQAAADDPRVFMLAGSCAACHGPDGDSPGAIPPLRGKSAQFIEMALREYKTGTSSATVMGRLARGYSDEEIRLIAAYFAGLKQESAQ